MQLLQIIFLILSINLITSYKSSIEAPNYVLMDVPYYFQLSSQVPGQGPRCCFSYSDAMTIEYLKPGAFGGDPDNYLLRVMEFGDTTVVADQCSAIESYGLQANFDFNGTIDRLLQLVSTGTPVPIDVLIHGPYTAPYGGGHYIVVIGYDMEGEYLIVNDPYGLMDPKNGDYLSHDNTAGERAHYPFKYIIPRWQNGTNKNGWMMVISE